MTEQEVGHNLGTRKLKSLREANYPDVGTVLRSLSQKRPEGAVDVMLVNPPAPDGGIWIRSQHRVGRRSRENMIWPQVSLAQLAAMLHPDYSLEVVDAIATRMTWHEFEQLLREKQPKYYLTQVTAPTLTNDMYGVFLAHSLGAKTMAFGTHVTPMVGETMERFPALDFVLLGEPELTLRELVDTLEAANGRWQVIDGHLQRADGRIADQEGGIYRLLSDTDPTWRPAWSFDGLSVTGDQSSAINHQLSAIKGLGWRRNGEIITNANRPFIANLDDLPMPMHHLLPLDEYRIPMIKGPYTFIVTSRGCTAGCKYCIKHVTYQYSVRVRSPENIMEELWLLHELGIHNIHMYADLFTVSRDQVVGLCKLIIEKGLKLRWTCNSRVDYVDEEMLQLMGKAGCWMISWGIESASEEILRRARKGAYPDKVERALRWSKGAGIGNWGYFIIGLPGETEETIRQTINFAKRLPLDLALFHIAAPYPGTPFFLDVIENGWFRPGTAWEEVDMDRSTVLDYRETGLTAERLEYWQKRATREWALRPGPIWTMLKGLNSWAGFKSAMDIGLQTLSFVRR
jgi:anaerobic magnesium-protoporphyrin IX monomethyl ester cyclase